MKCSQITLFLTIVISSISSKDLVLEFSWNKIDYVWPPSDHQYSLEENGTLFVPNEYDKYIYENNVPMGANKWRNKLFVSVPRRRAGIPSTLNFVWLNSTEKHNAPLIPYPDWNTNRLSLLNDTKIHLVSVYRTVIDDCDRLWTVDSGTIDTVGQSGKPTVIQKPAVVIIDLQTNQIIRRYFLKDSDITPTTAIVNLVVDVERSSCDDAYAYLPDLGGYGLVVYSFKEDDSWRVTHNYFHLESLSGDFNIGGEHFQWIDGIFSIALTANNEDGFKTAYFHALVGTHIFSVSTRILRNKELATRLYHGDDIRMVVDKGPNAQSAASDLHKGTGVLFFGLVNQNAFACWNTSKSSDISNFDVVFKDDEKFIYQSDVKIHKNEIIVLTNRMPIFIYKGLNFNDTNFRVWITNVKDAVKGTKCSDDSVYEN